jgi:hypothetical protein
MHARPEIDGGKPKTTAVPASLELRQFALGHLVHSSGDVGQPITFALNGSTDFAAAQQQVSDVPEPMTFVLLLPVVLAVGFRLRFRRLGRA